MLISSTKSLFNLNPDKFSRVFQTRSKQYGQNFDFKHRVFGIKKRPH